MVHDKFIFWNEGSTGLTRVNLKVFISGLTDMQGYDRTRSKAVFHKPFIFRKHAQGNKCQDRTGKSAAMDPAGAFSI